MKLLRLSLFNLKKNKREAAAVVFLTMITVFMLSVCVANSSKVKKVFDESFKRSGSINRIVIFKKDVYRDEFKRILEDEYRVSRLSRNPFIFAGATDVMAGSDEVVSYNFLFETLRTERKIESFVKTEAMSDDEAEALDHPIWLPEAFRIIKKLSVGDTFTIIKSGRDYPFTIAGFYITGLQASDGFGYKCVLSDEDYELFSMLFDTGTSFGYNCVGLCFDDDGDFDYDAFLERCGEASYQNLTMGSTNLSYESERDNETNFTDMFFRLIAIMSFITMVSALFMIRHKISSDMEDQLKQIGVLEALGYRAGEISLTYLYEYVISAGLGCVLGIILACLATPVINDFNEALLGRSIHGNTEVGKIIGIAQLIFVILLLFVLAKAGTVKKYPPVVAFRKGITTHSFRRNMLPLDKPGANINIRLAMKKLLMDIKSYLGVAVCIITAGITILFGMLSFDFFKDGPDRLVDMMGTDSNVVMVDLMSGVDPYAIREEILKMPEVRKALVTFKINELSIKGSDMSGTIQVFDDFNDAENIKPVLGRFPEHDNEAMISYRRSTIEDRALGDSIVLENAGIEKNYVITGIVSSMMNSGSSIYLTSDGYKRINIDARPDSINVYLNDGTGYDEFEEKLTDKFGISIKDAEAGNIAEGSLEERVRAVANEKMAVMMSQYGVTSIDYAVRVGDKLITGNSRPFVIKEVSTWQGMIKTQLVPIADTFKNFTLLSAVVIALIVAVILIIIAGSNVRRQRQSLGIMKGLGYSSRDLMTQMALSIMPVIIISLILASIGAVWFNKLFWLLMLGLIADTSIPVIIITDVVLAVFCYIVTYLGAGRIKKISVNELMTE